MLKFLLGTMSGAALAFAFVQFNVEPPAVLKLPEKLRGNLVSAATEADLYDLDADDATRTRALKIYFANRAGDAATLDNEAGHPFRAALYRARASREAIELLAAWSAYDAVLTQPKLRAALERKHDVTGTDDLKREMLFLALGEKPFLKLWLARNASAANEDNLLDALKDLAKASATQPAP